MREDAFGRYVKDALLNFYDPTRLQTHPLVNLLGLAASVGQTAGEALRELLRDTIERLQPPTVIPLDRPEWLSYRLLWARYVQSFNQAETCHELGLSQATYYRRHQEALSAVVSLLWELYRKQVAESRGDPNAEDAQLSAPQATQRNPPASDNSQTPWVHVREQAIQMATASPCETVSLQALFLGVYRMMAPVLQAQGLTLQVIAPLAWPSTFADPALLRHILLSTLAEGARRAAENTLQVEIRLEDNTLVWQLEPLHTKIPGVSASAMTDADPGLVISQTLLEVYGGKLWYEAQKENICTLCLALPIHQAKTILIVDDDGDAIQLYQRYLAAEGFAIRVAQHGDELEQQFEENLPDLILLDVLMPKWDGWTILQRLRTLPETSSIPVIICSVISQPELALALGANCVLRKPITQQQLLQAVYDLLQRLDSGDTGYPATLAQI